MANTLSAADLLLIKRHLRRKDTQALTRRVADFQTKAFTALLGVTSTMKLGHTATFSPATIRAQQMTMTAKRGTAPSSPSDYSINEADEDEDEESRMDRSKLPSPA